MNEKLKFFFRNLEEFICGFFLIIMISVVIVNVILRPFGLGIYWAEEVATISFVWAVFIGASATYKNKMDVGIDILITKTPPQVQKIIRLVIDSLLLILNGYILYMAINFTLEALQKPTPVLSISSAYVNSALILGFGLMSFHAIKFIIGDIKLLKTEPTA